MKPRFTTICVLLATLALLVPAVADVGPPAHLLITEREPGVFTIQWRVPTVLPPRAVPTPLLPDGCEPLGQPEVSNQPNAWLFTQSWGCDVPLTGQIVGLDFPFSDVALTTVGRVDLLSGDRFARLISPGDPPWRLPEGIVAPDPLEIAREGTITGAAHALDSWAHLAFVVVVGLLGGIKTPLRLLSVFLGAQVVGVVGADIAGTSIPLPAADLLLALATVLVARQSLKPEAERTRMSAIVALAGVAHGVAAGSLLAAIGMDAVHLLVAAVVIPASVYVLGPGLGRPFSYLGGATAAALALALMLGAGATVAEERPTDGVVTPVTQASATTARESQRVGPAAGAAVQSFLVMEPFESRHEVMVELASMAELLGLDVEGVIEVGEQDAIATQIGELVVARTAVQIDGATAAPELQRADYMSVDATGVLPRENPIPEPVAEAVLGVVVAYPTEGMPESVVLDWQLTDELPDAIPTTVIDPESVQLVDVSADSAQVTWQNQLMTDPIPTIEAIPVEPTRVPVPLASIPLFGLCVAALWAARKSEHRAELVAVSRVALALGLLLGPMLTTSFAVPGSVGRSPTDAQARRMLAALLPNVYRALEFRDEGRIYDRLEVTVTGDMLTEVYLQQRRSLELEERGGAQARVETVEVLEATEVESQPDGFTVRGIWTVGGMVTHFGHRHFRQNRYDARIGLAAIDGTWKIRSFEVLEQERMQ